MNGNTEKLASLVSCDVLIVPVANEYTFPLAPTPTNPEVRDGRDRDVIVAVPAVRIVEDELANVDCPVVDEYTNVARALNVLVLVNVLAVYVLGERSVSR